MRLLAAALTTLAVAAGAADRAGTPATPVPVLVELFTSEGCSSCPPADALLARLVQEQPVPAARVIALGEHVDYWNRLGWKDPYSAAEFSHRQEAHARHLGLVGVYTPQMVVDGRLQAVGGDEAALRAAIAEAARETKGRLAIRLAERAQGSAVVEVEAAWPSAAEADVLLAVTESGLESRVTRGENAGRLLSHAAVVRRLTRIGVGAGSFSGRLAVPLGQGAGSLEVVAFVEERSNGRVAAVGTLRIAL
jgi:hypothetical protein